MDNSVVAFLLACIEQLRFVKDHELQNNLWYILQKTPQQRRIKHLPFLSPVRLITQVILIALAAKYYLSTKHIRANIE